MNIATAKDLTKCYNALCAVDKINFEITKGECFGFLGPNGAGKTTVMSIIYCFMPPTSSEVKVFDTDVTKDPGNIKARLGVMPQENNLDPDLTGRSLKG
jgi:lipooligosaccharide transport system ATP-binding protein